MEFGNGKPIYIQIADNISERILAGELQPGERIASVREWGAEIGVNPNTVARSYELLTSRGVIRNQRGIGYFITEGAMETIKENEREIFIKEELPAFLQRAELLGINLNNYINGI